ncbi:MAG: efflux RND transporter periplasmic adaptor subunit [Hyphomicrobium sp.]|uniref:efflux RND transporter periplasmic adaptor subunit n=1 Tax=Hyphomicrobium sp. TaxID=82 RepID=UPI003D12CB8E
MTRARFAACVIAALFTVAPARSAAQHESHGTGPAAPAPPSASGASPIPGMVEVSVPSERRQMIGVRTEALARRRLMRGIRTVGLVAADERRVRKIQLKISGWVDRLFVSYTGAFVRAGEPVLAIYSPELVAAQREYLLALRASRSGSADGEMRDLLDSSETRLRLWDLTEAQLRELERTGSPRRIVTLHSPTEGYVTLKPVYAGMYVGPDMELYTVTDLSHVWVWADLYEPEVDLIRLGQPVELSIAAEPGRMRSATVSYVNPTLDMATRTLRVRLDVDNTDGALKPGMYATVSLESPIGDVLALPEDAVIDTGERRIVFVEITNGRFQPREVSLGRKGQGSYEVLSGLREGDRVVVSAQFLLDSESRLRAASSGPAHGGH